MPENPEPIPRGKPLLFRLAQELGHSLPSTDDDEDSPPSINSSLPSINSSPPSFLRVRHLVVELVGRRSGDVDGDGGPSRSRKRRRDEADHQDLLDLKLVVPLSRGREATLDPREIDATISQYLQESFKTASPLSPTSPLPPVQDLQPNPDDHTSPSRV